MKVIDEDEYVHDSNGLPELIKNIIKSDNMISIGKLIADDAYYNNDIFRFLSDNNGILPCIKVRQNARIKLKKDTFLETCWVVAQKNDLQEWKDSVSYGQRWIIESIFSRTKRKFEG